MKVQTCRPSSNEVGNVHKVWDRVNLGMPSDPSFEQVCTWTWRPWSNEFGGHVHLWLEEYLETADVDRVDVEAVNSETIDLGPSIHEPFDPTMGDRVQIAMGSWDSIHSLRYNCANVENGVPKCHLRDDRWQTDCKGKAVNLGMIQYSVYAGFVACSSQCMLNSLHAVLSVCCTWCMLYSVYAVLSVCCTRCMLYSVYAVLGMNTWSWHGEIERVYLTLCALVMVELRTRKRDIGRDYGNHHDRLGLQRISCRSLFTIPNTERTSPDPSSNEIDMLSSKPCQVCRTPDPSYLLEPSCLSLSSSPSLRVLSTALPTS